MDTKLSLGMIVKDEEKVLARCFDSVKNLGLEIVIVDTGSKDKTVEIARRYTDKVLSFPWINDFAAARNFSFEHCTGDFILWLDADDVINPEDCRKIQNVDYSDKNIIISDYIFNHDEFGNDDLVVPRERIIKRSLGLKWQGRIHETIAVSVPAYHADFKVHHWRQHSSSERNLSILENIVRGDNALPGSIAPGVEARNIYYLAREYQDIGKIDDAIVYYQEFVDRKEGWWEDVFHGYYKLAECFFIQNNDAEVIKNIFKAIEIEPQWSEPYCLLGLLHFNRKRYRQAIHWYEVAASIKRPKELLSSFRTQYYTWLPHLQLGLCYNAIGDMYKAYEHNRVVLKYRPQDKSALNNDAILGPARFYDQYKKDGQGKKLNLGCGNKPIEGYVNVDIFNGPSVDEVFELDKIPYKAETISAISSEHALEHLPHDSTRPTLQEWFRVLMPGGELHLKIPDLELCCREYINAPINDPNFFKTKCWFKWTLFGAQKGQNGEPDEAQFHKIGYSKDEMRMILTEIGFIVESITNYNGFGTPSMEIRAFKPKKGPRIAWVAPENWEAAQTRIRVLNINKWLATQGCFSRVVDYESARNYDTVIVGKSFSEPDYKAIQNLKSKGKKIYVDLCEDILEYPWVSDILKISDKVICCSHVLEEKVQSINPRTMVIEDAWETA